MRARALLAICSALACSRAPPAGLGFTARELPAARTRGRALFLINCALCHGERADGHGRQTFGFERPPADLRRAEFHGAEAEPRVLQALRDGVPGTAMPGWKDTLSDAEVRALAAYVVNLEEVPDVPGLWMR